MKNIPYRIIVGSPYLQPICTIQLIGLNRQVPLDVLVDSGATYSVFPRQAAEDAGIILPPYANQPILFGSGRQQGFRKEVYLDIMGNRLRADVVFVERLPFSYALLGRVGVFAKFKEVAFCEQTNPFLRLDW